MCGRQHLHHAKGEFTSPVQLVFQHDTKTFYLAMTRSSKDNVYIFRPISAKKVFQNNTTQLNTGDFY
jgi:hypothetical protein